MSFKGKGTEVSRAGLAEYLGVALTTVDRYVKDGAPVVQRGGRGIEWKFNTADFRRWEMQREREKAQGDIDQTDMNELRRRKLLAETRIVEVELKRTLRKLAPASYMRKVLATMGALVQQKMLALPFRLEGQLVGETDARRFKQVMELEVRESLEDIAKISTDEFKALMDSLADDGDDEDDFSTTGEDDGD